MTTYKDLSGDDCVFVQYADGSTWSGLQSAYDAMQAQLGTIK